MQQEIARLRTELDNVKKKPDTIQQKPAPVASPVSLSGATVYFALGAKTLTPSQISKLDKFRNRSAADKLTFTLTGYTDAVGNAAANESLAQKRVQYVQDLLVTQFDIPADHIRQEPPVTSAAKGSKQNALNRKVTIVVQ